MKKFISLSLIACGIFVLAGCNKINGNDTHGAANTTSQTQVGHFVDDVTAPRSLTPTITVLGPIGQVNVSQGTKKNVYAIKITAGQHPITITNISFKNAGGFVNSNEIGGFTLRNGIITLQNANMIGGSNSTNQTISFNGLNIVIPGSNAANAGGSLKLLVTADITSNEISGHTLKLGLASINITDNITANNIYLQGNSPVVNPLNYILGFMYFN